MYLLSVFVLLDKIWIMNIRVFVLGMALCLGLMSSVAMGQKIAKPAAASQGWEKEWKQVDSLSDIGLPKSAMEIVDRIYLASKSGKDLPQFIKAVIYKIKLNSYFREDFLIATIRDLELEVKQAQDPSKQILQSILAEVISKYYENNQYRFNDRSRVVNVKPDSIQTWDLNTLMKAVYSHYLLSLQNEQLLKSVPILDYKAILEIPPSGYNRKTSKTDLEKAIIFRPTLYDFLANRALDFFTSSNGPKSKSAYGFTLNNPSYFAASPEFARMQIPLTDSLSQELQAIRIYQSLVSFHLDDANPAALIDADLARLSYVKEKAVTSNNDSLYLEALKKLESRYKDSPWSAGVSFTIAKFFNEQGSRKENDPAHKYDLKTALDICISVLKRFPDSEGAKDCRILAETIRSKDMEIKHEAVVFPGTASLALINYKNLKTVYLRLFKVEQSAWDPKKEKLKKDEMITFLLSQQETKTWEQPLPDFGDFRSHSIETILPETIAGFYVLLVSADSSFSPSAKLIAYSDYSVTSFNYINRRNKNGSISLFVFNRNTGMPMSGITVEAWVKNYNYQSKTWETKKMHDLKTDHLGFATLPPIERSSKYNNLYCKLIYADDVLFTSTFYQYPVVPAVERAYKQTSFFTDRAIYRPGQTVWFKGILMEKKGYQTKLLTNEQTKVGFTDVNGRRISEQLLTTNDFGSFNGSFVAPADVLPGQMFISNESGSVSFSVEQYKRPTFSISFEPLEGNYRLNETLTLKGKAMAYAGNAITQANVSYRVVRNTRFPWWERWYYPFPSSPETEITNGVVKTSDDGTFSIKFTAIPDFSVARSTNPVFDFQISVDVTDINGETQSDEQRVTVGYQSLLLSMNQGAKLNLQNDSLIQFTATNLNGKSTPVKMTVNISRLDVPDRAFIKRNWEKPDTTLIPEQTFHEIFPDYSYGNENDTTSWKSSTPPYFKTMNLSSDSILSTRNMVSENGKPFVLETGVYKVELTADDPFGEKVRLNRYIAVYDPGLAALPGSPVNWFVPLKTTAKPGETAGFLIGSKEKNVNVMYEIFAGDSLLSRKWFSLSGFQMQIDVPVLETYRGNFSVNFVFSKFNRVYQNSQMVAVPYADNKLNIVFETFRSKILPGEKEQWKIHISKPDKQPASAEFLASMYDASLDAFRANNWLFGLAGKFFGSFPWDLGSSYSTRSASASAGSSSGSYTEHQYPGLNWFGLNYFGGRQYPMMMKSGRTGMAGMQDNTKAGMVVSQNVTADAPPPPEANAIEGVQVNGEEKQKPVSEQPVLQIRRDFRETAFFYPDLLTDSAGNLSLSFTAPDALTKWKFQGFAYTANLDYNLVEKELVTRKDLMVMPNAPRFVRQGDKLVFSTKVVNLSEQDLKATVHIELTNGLSMKSIDSLVTNLLSQEVSIPKGRSSLVNWTIQIPVDPSLSLLQYRIIAVSGAFSDGEEKIIPVLPNRMMVTESLPLPVRDKGTFDFSFDKLLSSSADKTLKNFRLTLEFASNPAWYAIQALPALNDKTYDDAYSTFGAFYSNSIASHIMNSDPKIKTVFESWKNLTPDALLSNLEKNQQLKSVLLQQTPWVMEAKTESDNRSRLGMYFDPDNLRMNLQKNLNRLQKLQTPGGGFTWFDGMPESRFISQDIISGLAHLKHLGVSVSAGDQQLSQMLTKGLRYMDEAFRLNYEELKRRYPTGMKDNNLNILEIQYLYTRSYFLQDQPMPANTTEALNYWISQATQYWTKEGLSSQAMLSLALERFGKKDVSALIIKSLTERSLHSPEMGMYWAQEQGWYWQQAPVETQAALIEAFDEVGKDKKAVEEMKIWLLKQKQTQSWTSTRATVEACYALLLRGTSQLTEDPKIKISLGKIKVDPSKLSDVKQEAGTGYFTMSWSGNEITPDMGNVKVSKGSDGVAWGALYWQYFQNMDKITKASTSLKLEKKLFLETNTPSGPVLQPVGDNSSLKPGDKLKVRIILTTDRNLEFVHMGDQRASAFEPGAGSTLSGYHYQDGLGYYQSTTDVSTDFFFYYIPKGTYVFEYPLLVNAAGDYSNGITTIQCLYAPEFSAHSEGIRVQVAK